MYPVVLLSGKAGSGKDTVADIMATECFANAQKIALADPIKRFAYNVLGMDEEVLWGPSENRSKEFDSKELDRRYSNAQTAACNWCSQIAQSTAVDSGVIFNRLERWMLKYVHKVGLEEGKPITARSVLQTLGTEFGRSIDPGIWVNHAKLTSDQLLGGGWEYSKTTGPRSKDGAKRTDVVLITDGRFRNEVLAVNSWGGATIKVWNPEVKGLAGEAAKHASETEQDSIPDWWFALNLMNNKAHGLEPLRRTVKHLSDDLFVSTAQIRGGHSRFTLGY